jgi:valyl-tRNA synthetase
MNGGGVGRRAAPPPSAVEAASSAAPSPPTPSTSPSALPKVFDPDAEEAAIYASWEASGAFQPRDAAPGETNPPPYFSMAMPPPNVTGRLHMGHAMFVALQDALTRQARMAGRPTLWLPGTDHAGIATQLVVEKQLAAAGESRLALGRAAFEDRVWAWKRDYGGAITRQLRALGASCDWSRERFTLDDGLSAAVREAFVRLADDGLVYRGAYLVNWSPSLRTAVSDLEVEYAEEEGTLYTFKYPLAGAADPTSDGGHLPVATTRPETIPGDAAVAVNPADPRYGHLVGKRAVVPGSGGRTIPIIADDGVDIEFGTGALKITPGHDPADYDIGVKHGLPVINIMDDAGALAGAAAGAYAGLDRFDARTRVWADLGAAGLAISTAPHTSRVPRSQRGGEIVEPLVREQWFVRMGPLAAPALAAVRDGATRVVPPRFAGLYDGWLTNIRDWCVSRQLWWGHRIPVWYVFDDAAAAAASPDGRSPRYVVARDDADAATRAAAAHGPGKVLRQETDVLDTWFSSALWPFSTLGWPADPAAAPDLARFYPTSVLETGHDILFFWVARMMMMGIKLTGRPPFHTIYLHGLVRDSAGRKMSKSVGNVVDPVDVIKGAGADALRHTLATGTAAGQDLNLNPEKVAAARNLTNKLWNAGKFVLMSLEAAGEGGDGAPPVRPPPLDTSPAAVAALPLSDRWILAALATTVARVTAAYERHDFGDAGRAAADHFWGDFADWYVESAKPRLYAAGDADPTSLARTRAVLLHAYEGALALLHPTMPFVTERLWRALPGAAGRSPDLITAAWPTVEGAGGVDEGALAAHAVLRGVVGAIRNVRAEYGVELGRRVPATIAVADDGLRAALSAELDVIATLAKLDAGATEVVASAPAAGAGRAGAVVSDGVQVSLPLAGLFDVAKELARLAKARDKAAAVADKAAARVGDARFAANAPADVVAKARAEADDAAAKVAALDAKMEEVRRMG